MIPTMKYCPQCGAHLEPNDKFCRNCGARLSDYDHALSVVVARTPKPIIAGVLCLITGILAVFTVIFWALEPDLFSLWLPPILDGLLLSAAFFATGLTIGGAICNLQRIRWRFALIGSICTLVFCFPLGIPAVILTAIAKQEFS